MSWHLAGAFLLVSLEPATLPWLVLHPERDARTPEMARFDERMDEHLVGRLNETPELEGLLAVSRSSVRSILRSRAPFASLHFDPTKPASFTEEEKRALEEFFLRGGFLLLVEDNYPYFERDYRRRTEGTLFDFFAKELPSRNPGFTVATAGLDHPIFTQNRRIEIPPFIAEEMEENPGYRGETIFLHEDRLVAYTLSLYAFHAQGEHVPLREPFLPYDLILSGYELLVNLYLYISRH